MLGGDSFRPPNATPRSSIATSVAGTPNCDASDAMQQADASDAFLRSSATPGGRRPAADARISTPFLLESEEALTLSLSA